LVGWGGGGGEIGATKQALCHTVTFSLRAAIVKLNTVNCSMIGKPCLVIMTLTLSGKKIENRFVWGGDNDDSVKVIYSILCSILLLFRLIF
jgi:hypothetical protein